MECSQGDLLASQLAALLYRRRPSIRVKYYRQACSNAQPKPLHRSTDRHRPQARGQPAAEYTTRTHND